MWRAPLRLNVKMSGAGLDAEAQGTAEPWASDPRANVNLRLRGVNLAPLIDLKPSDAIAQNISLSSRVSLAGGKLTFDDLDSAISGSRLRGRLAVTLDDERTVEGEVGLDALDLAPAFALAIGAAGHDAAEPLGSGLLKGWRGRIAFQALRGVLPGGGELRPVSGTVKSDGQSLTFDAVKGTIGGGEATANIDAKQSVNGIALNARVQLSGVDGAALRYRALAMPAGRVSMQMTLASQGRSTSALAGALSGSGTVTLESARVAGLRSARLRCRDPRQRQRTGDRRHPVAADRRACVVGRRAVDRVGANSVHYQGRPASDQCDHARCRRCARHRVRWVRHSRRSGRHPRQSCFDGGGAGDQPSRNSDVRRGFTRCAQPHGRRGGAVVMAGGEGDRSRNPPAGFDRARRGSPPALPASIPPPVTMQPSATTPEAFPSDQPLSEGQLPDRGPRRTPSKPRIGVPRPPGAPAGPPLNPNPPVVSQQVAPLPPPIEVRPAPGVARPPKPRPPMVLMPPAAGPQ